MNTLEIRSAAEKLDRTRAALALLESTLQKLQLTGDQRVPVIAINGVEFTLAGIDRNSGWMPRAVKATEGIRAAAIALVEAQISMQRSKVEGAEFGLRRILRGSA